MLGPLLAGSVSNQALSAKLNAPDLDQHPLSPNRREFLIARRLGIDRLFQPNE